MNSDWIYNNNDDNDNHNHNNEDINCTDEQITKNNSNNIKNNYSNNNKNNIRSATLSKQVV